MATSGNVEWVTYSWREYCIFKACLTPDTSKNYIFSNFFPLHDTHFSHLRIHLSKNDLKCSCRILWIMSWTMEAKSSRSAASKLLPPSSDFKVGKSQKSHGARSREYAGWFTVSSWYSQCCTEEWDGALSWCNMNLPSSSCLYLFTAHTRSFLITWNCDKKHRTKCFYHGIIYLIQP